MQIKNNPKVSIIIPVYNGSNYLKEAINSALSQTYKNIEIIVVNDGSNDKGKTEKIAKSYGKKIRYYIKENGGVSSALNFGIEKMAGEYFSWLSHDDIYLPKKIETEVKYINKYKNKNVILFADYGLIDKESKYTGEVICDHEILIKKPEYSLLRGYINGITLLIPKSAFIENGLFNTKLKCTQDYDMWRRLMRNYKFVHISENLTRTRIHPLQDSNKHPDVAKEGNMLWINMIKDISLARKKELEGSEFNFYREMSLFLRTTPYLGTLKYVSKKIEEIYKQFEDNVGDIKVSVIIPFFNRIPLLINAIKSVQNQTHQNFELILINDGSTDNTNQLKGFIAKDKRIILINLIKNAGQSTAKNKGIEIATGDYIAFLDSDDMFLPEKIHRQLLYMYLTKYDVSHTSYFKKEKGKKVLVNTGILTGKVIPKIIAKCRIATPTVMIKRKYLMKVKTKFNTKLHIAEDVCFLLALLRKTDLLGIAEPLSIVNVNERSTSSSLISQRTGILNILRYVLSDNEYINYTNEIAELCHSYVEINNRCSGISKTTYNYWDRKPSNIFLKVIYLFEKQGIALTIKKVLNKYLKSNPEEY